MTSGGGSRRLSTTLLGSVGEALKHGHCDEETRYEHGGKESADTIRHSEMGAQPIPECIKDQQRRNQ